MASLPFILVSCVLCERLHESSDPWRNAPVCPSCRPASAEMRVQRIEELRSATR